MDRNLALDLVRVTEAAALSAGRWVGRGDENSADAAAVESMRKAFDSVLIDATIVIGEGERDEAPMLYIGEKVGGGANGKGPKIDIACDPLEGTSITARGGDNAMAVIAAAEDGNFLHAPDVYMMKLAVGPQARDVIDIRESVTWNLQRIAKAKNKSVQDLVLTILERDRHADIIGEARQAGAIIRLIGDGDVQAAISTAEAMTGVDVLMGTGGAPEGVIAAAALRCMGGGFQGKLMFRTDAEKGRAAKMGITDYDRIYQMDELAKGNVMFVATGVTNGSWLRGVQYSGHGASTHSIVMRSQTGTVREIKARHNFSSKPNYGW